jgi:hypothetical protein
MTQSIQTSVDRTVSDITPDQRHAIEELVGGDLAPDQRIFVLAYRPGIEYQGLAGRLLAPSRCSSCSVSTTCCGEFGLVKHPECKFYVRSAPPPAHLGGKPASTA